MNTILIPGIFYVIFSIYIICLYRNKSLGILFTPKHFEVLKYQGGTSVFFLININIMFYCMYCKECNTFCLAFTMLGVSLGTVIYLWHLGKQTVHSIKQIAMQNEFDLMAPFFSIPYFILIYDIACAVYHSTLANLQPNESKMILVVLYPFFIVLGELNTKIKQLKDSDNKDA